MKNTSLFASFLCTGIMLFAASTKAQLKWPEDKKTATEKYALLQDNYKTDYNTALQGFRWLFKEAPDLSRNLYVYGTTAYEAKLAATSDAAMKRGLQDTILLLYDSRAKYFPEDKAQMLNYKGYYAYSYLMPRAGKLKELYELYVEAYTLNKDKFFPYNAYCYLDVACRYKSETKGAALNDEKVLEIHEELSKTADKNIAAGTDAENWKKYKAELDKIVEVCVKLDCDFVKNNLAAKFKANPTDLGLAKKIMSIMMSGKCTEDPLYEQATDLILEKEPSYGLAYRKAFNKKQNKEFEAAIELYKKAISLTDEGSKQADCYMSIASIHSVSGRKSAAREAAYSAIKADAAKAKDAYQFIGDLYMSSTNECKGENDVKSRLVYIAAYEMYQKAGASGRMRDAQAQFPASADIFTQGLKEGTAINTGCWISETVTLKARPK
jgi:hypothetical protein